MSKKTYSQVLAYPTFEERLEFLKLRGVVAYQTFGGSRWVNQGFYSSKEWKNFRRDIILRDNGCDLGLEDFPIYGKIILHHITPISKDDLLHGSECLLDPNNVICVSLSTHNAIHYGDADLALRKPIVRTPNDTCPWKGGRL